MDKISFVCADFTRKATKRVSITEAGRRTETGMLLGIGLDLRLAKRYVRKSLLYHHLSVAGIVACNGGGVDELLHLWRSVNNADSS